MIADRRRSFLSVYSPERYSNLLRRLQDRCGVPVEFRVAETPVFLPRTLLDAMAQSGVEMTRTLLNDAAYIDQARAAIPTAYRFAGETNRPHFLTAEFGFVREPDGSLAPRLLGLRGAPSLYGFQDVLACSYRAVYGLGDDLEAYLSGLDSAAYWNTLCLAVLGRQDPESVVLLDLDPERQKARPDYEITARKLGIAVVDITTLRSEGGNLSYTNRKGRQVPIRRMFNRAKIGEVVRRGVRLPVDFTRPVDVEWAGHPVWHFLISGFSLPYLSRSRFGRLVPPAVFLDDFLSGPGRIALEEAGVRLPAADASAVYDDLLLKPLFSSAEEGVQRAPSREQLLAIQADRRRDYLVQQRLDLAPAVETPCGSAEAKVRVLYVWPNSGVLTPVISMVELGRAERGGAYLDQQFRGASAAFFPR